MREVDRSFAKGALTTHVLKKINLSITAGEYVSIIGPSGSGKSTLLNILGCLDRVSSGEYLFDDVDVRHLSDNQLSDLRNRSIGFVFQSFHLLKDLNARANVELPLIYRGIVGTVRHKAAAEALDRVGLTSRAHHFPSQMSGGEQQRVAIARALVGRPRLILADEPTGALDSRTSADIMQLFADLNKEAGITIVQVTHDTEVAYYASRIIRIFDGRIASDEQVTEKRRQQAMEALTQRGYQYQEELTAQA